MKISVEKCTAGTALKCFIPKSEITPAMKYITNDISKDIRKQKTYKKNLSKQKISLLQKILEDLFSNFSTYRELEDNNKNNSYMYDIVKNKVFQNLELSMDEYQKKSFNLVYEIAKSFVFDINHSDEIYTTKDTYKLDSNSDILISIIGAFRYGKTTLIKKLFGFGDDFIFPLVDKGRTSLNNCFFRGMLVKDNNITIVKKGENDKIISADEYNYKNTITLHNFEDFFKLTLFTNLHNAFDLYCNLKKENTRNTVNLHNAVLEKFIANDKANLDEIFGDINNYSVDGNDDNFYSKMLYLFKESFDNIPDDAFDYDENKKIQIPHEYKDALDNNNAFLEFTLKYFDNKIQRILDEIRSKTKNPIIYENNTITFTLKRDEIGDIDLYYNNFISNNAKYRGQLLRLLVSEIYTEIDLELNTFYSQENTVINHFENISSIIFTDTMGAGHKANKNNNVNDSSNDIINNLPLLNESDIIILLDDASQSMKDVTLSQIKSLVNFGLKDKLLLTYSWYDYFLKNDMKNDAERVRTLCNVLNEKLNECFNTTLNTAQKLYSSLMENEMDRIVFLKGLVPYVPKNNTTNKSSRRIRKSTYIDEISDEELANNLNCGEDFGEFVCLKSLLGKIISLNNNLKILNDISYTLKTNISETNVVYNFFEKYKNFYKEFISSQYNEYLLHTPSYKTTEALCNRLKHGNTGFTGINRSLYPYNDALSILMKHINVFIEDVFKIQIAIDEEGNKKDNALSEDFILNKIKNNFSKKIGDFFYLLMITSNKNDWINFYNDWGSGVQDRRANNIYNTLVNTMKIRQENEESNISVASYNLFKLSVNNIVDQYDNN